jgi:hypothetical protein
VLVRRRAGITRRLRPIVSRTSELSCTESLELSPGRTYPGLPARPGELGSMSRVFTFRRIQPAACSGSAFLVSIKNRSVR